jgi:hypothetical protein
MTLSQILKHAFLQREKKVKRRQKERHSFLLDQACKKGEKKKALLRALLLLQSVCLINAETGPDHFVCLSRFFMAETDPLSFSKTPRKKMQKSPTREENACGYIR